MLTFTLSNRGNKLLQHNNFLYQFHRKTKEKIHWHCIRKKSEGCRAKVWTVNEDSIMRSFEVHFHEPENIKIDERKFTEKLKKLVVENPDVPVPQLYKQLVSETSNSAEEASNLPSYDKLDTSLYRARANARAALMLKNVDEIDLSDALMIKTEDDGDFLPTDKSNESVKVLESSSTDNDMSDSPPEKDETRGYEKNDDMSIKPKNYLQFSMECSEQQSKYPTKQIRQPESFLQFSMESSQQQSKYPVEQIRKPKSFQQFSIECSKQQSKYPTKQIPNPESCQQLSIECQQFSMEQQSKCPTEQMRQPESCLQFSVECSEQQSKGPAEQIRKPESYHQPSMEYLEHLSECPIEQIPTKKQRQRSSSEAPAKRFKPNDNNILVSAETFQTVKPIFEITKPGRDEYDMFGDLISHKIRNLRTEYSKATVQHLINSIVYEAQMGKYDYPNQGRPYIDNRGGYGPFYHNI